MTVEAVNSVIASSAVARGSVDQISASRAAQVAAPSGDGVSLETPYRSLNVEIDTNYDRAVLQVRDSQTGDVLNQFPSDTALRAQNAAQQSAAPQPEPLSGSASQGGGSEAGSSVPDISTTDIAQAQVASQALSAAAQTGVEGLSAGVSVSA